MIRFEGVGKRYPPGIDALANISTEVGPGEMVVIRGHSGAGKSTLLRLIAAMERPTSGALLVNGKNLAAIGRSGIPYLRRSLGLVFQDQKLLFDRNALENVLLPLSISGFPPAEARRRAQAALDKVGLLAREKAMPIMLSGGEQQRLAIARAVVSRPAIVLADEPTAHLDAATASDIGGILQEFQRVGTTVLVATYDATPFGTARQLHLDHGRLQ
jgi:cell division transport system ATP-binding protein